MIFFFNAHQNIQEATFDAEKFHKNQLMMNDDESEEGVHCFEK